MKQLWSEPQITEIKVRMTEDDKVGDNTDMWTNMTGLDGDIVPDGTCCCS